MASKEYVSIFVPRYVRNAIKRKAIEHDRTMIEELRTMYGGGEDQVPRQRKAARN